MKVAMTFDGRRIEAEQGCSVASTVFEHAEGKAFRRSVDGEPRSALCGMGICFECRLQVDGQPHQRTCQLPVREGLRLETDFAAPDLAGGQRAAQSAAQSPSQSDAARSTPPSTSGRRLAFDIAVVGAGPAGVAAAVTAGEAGCRVALIDDNPEAGGQIWRPSREGHVREAWPWIERLDALGQLVRLHGSAVIDASPPGRRPARLALRTPQGAATLEASQLVLATGARELFLPFPGWTLPGVVGAGGLQALIKSGLDVAGKRVVIAGSGPLLLAVAALVRQKGGHVLLVAEQATASNVRRFAAGLLRQPSKWLPALSLARQIASIAVIPGLWPVAAHGDGQLESVRLSDGRVVDCDLLACGFGLLPESSLARYLGAEVDAAGAIRVDGRQQTSLGGVFAAGECTGVGGAPAALVEGQIAGLAAADGRAPARLVRAREAQRRFAARLATAFRPRAELRVLPDPETVVCRCEDVRWHQLAHYRADEVRRAKLETRCGMGPCQGRVCGGALSFLLDFGPDRIRPPFFPTPLEDLMTEPAVITASSDR